jgi:2,4-dienoyl-CoA reductase-like NADH-dependent reductase (Old Yellow Enzyme family)
VATPLLFTPLRLRGLELKNRIVVSPMCQYQAVEGRVVDWHHQHHARLALGGVGTAFVEATGVTRDGRITHGCTGIWEDGQVPGLRRISDLYRSHGVVPGIQIGHSGRRGSAARPWEGAGPLANGGPDPAWETVGPSPVPEREGYPVPRELTAPEIEGLVEAFRQGARRALAAGFDVVEIHGAHGYLLHSFFSPVSNRRGDAFGGSLAGRMRLPLLAAEAVRSEWPDGLPVFYRASCVDGVEGGLTIGDTVALARALKERGHRRDRLLLGRHVGAGDALHQEDHAGLPSALRGGGAERGGDRDHGGGRDRRAPARRGDPAGGASRLVALGRELLAEPSWPYRAALALGLENPHAVLPPAYAFYLERRAAVLER